MHYRGICAHKCIQFLKECVMDPRAFSFAHCFLHLSTYILPNCPACSCRCPGPIISSEVPASVNQALEFCHNIASSCSPQPRDKGLWTFSLFWFGFICGIFLGGSALVLYQFAKRVIGWVTATLPTSSSSRPAVENNSVKPANPRVLKELGVIEL